MNMDCNTYLEEKMFDCKNRIESLEIHQQRPQTNEQSYWYFMGVYDGYHEVYLKINSANYD